MSEEAHAHHDATHSDAHYIKIWAFLLVLLIISIIGPEVAENFDPATGTWIVLLTAFGIAFWKAFLVIKHFMHLTVEKPIVGYILITCLVFMVLFFAGVSPDIMKHTGTGWVNTAAQEEIKRAEAAAAAEGHGDEAGDATGDQAHEAAEPAAKPEPSADEQPAKEVPVALDQMSEEDKKAWLMNRGEEIYTRGSSEAPGAACAMCHGSSGTGHGPHFPPLTGDGVKQWVGDCQKHAEIIINGMEGELTLGEQTYNYPMPGFDGLTNRDVAAVATYVANSFGNDFGVVCTPDDVRLKR